MFNGIAIDAVLLVLLMVLRGWTEGEMLCSTSGLSMAMW
jgi:hypothetical protein